MPANSPWMQVFGFSVLDHVPVGSCVLNSRLEVVFWNRVLERWTGIDRWDILNRDICEFFPHFDQSQYRYRLADIFGGGPPLVLSSQLHGQIFPSKCADGRPRLQHTTVTGIPTHDGSGCLACFAVEDVSEVTRRIADLKETRDQAEKLADEARRASTAKGQFLANMSHELRTPLNSILLLSGLLAEEPEGQLADSDRHSVQIIQQSGRALLEMVNDILDFSKGEAGRRDVLAENVSLPVFWKFLEDSLGIMATHKGLQFAIEVDPEVPDHFLTDEQALTQIMRNLVSNAVKFTGSGGVTVRVWMESPDWHSPEEETGPWLAVAVRDTGPGIALDRQEAVFEPFCQEDGTISRQFGGTGLGLSICRQLVEMLGGRLLLDSRPGQGSTFTVYLPPHVPESGQAAGQKRSGEESRAAPAAVPRPPEPPVPTGPEAVCAGEEADEHFPHRLEGLRVLVADRDMRSLYTAAGTLQAAGAEVITAASLADAVAKIVRQPGIDVVLMDMAAPDGPDPRALHDFRTWVTSHDVPVLCMTCRQGGKECRNCENCLASDRLLKPFPRQVLVEMIEQLQPLPV